MLYHHPNWTSKRSERYFGPIRLLFKLGVCDLHHFSFMYMRKRFLFSKKCVTLNGASIAAWDFFTGPVKKDYYLPKAAFNSPAFSTPNELPGGWLTLKVLWHAMECSVVSQMRHTFFSFTVVNKSSFTSGSCNFFSFAFLRLFSLVSSSS